MNHHYYHHYHFHYHNTFFVLISNMNNIDIHCLHHFVYHYVHYLRAVEHLLEFLVFHRNHVAENFSFSIFFISLNYVVSYIRTSPKNVIFLILSSGFRLSVSGSLFIISSILNPVIIVSISLGGSLPFGLKVFVFSF